MLDEIDTVLSEPSAGAASRFRDAASGLADEGTRPSPTLSEIRAAGKNLTSKERRVAMRMALDETRGNVEQAARLLGISRRSFYHWMDRYGVDRSG